LVVVLCIFLPTLALRNFVPILESKPQACDISWISDPTSSHKALNELILEILWASKAFAVFKVIEYKLLFNNLFF